MRYQIKKDAEKRYTWQDYLTWPDEERWEVIDGVAYDMSPSPTERHQRIVLNMGSILRTKLGSNPCKVYVAPLDVYLDDFNFVQPDVMIVCNKEKIKDRIYGPPDMVIEVISPSTSLKDKRIKKALYERFGVKEYILVHPEEMFIERYSLADGKFREPDIFGPQEVLNLTSVEGMDISLWEVFETAPPEAETE
ncbi:MAG TPA: Uma2 family endonuclease [Nitrospiraceae bacterium]|nr:Uma2 family endonuclease [Nitrospiraceae bacterium]